MTWVKRLAILASTGAAVAFLTPLTSAFASSSPTPQASPDTQSCPAHYEYDVTSSSNYHSSLGPLFKDYNGGSKGVDESFTATVGGSVSLSVSVSGTFDIDAIIAGAKLTTTVALQGTVTVSAGTTASVYTPAHWYGYGQYGVWERNTTGNYYHVNSNCTTSGSQVISAKVPENSSGWDAWASSS